MTVACARLSPCRTEASSSAAGSRCQLMRSPGCSPYGAVRIGVEGRGRGVLRPSSVSLEVRRASWDRLWQILLRELPNDDVEQQESEPSSESAETNDGAAPGASGEGGGDVRIARVS